MEILKIVLMHALSYSISHSSGNGASVVNVAYEL